MTPPTIVFGREKKFRLGGTSFPTLEDFFLGPGSRTKYGYDADGNVLSQENKNAESLSNTYLYDAANRLINWVQGVTQMKTYSYNSVGNNIDSSSTGGKYNSDNEETTINNGGLQPAYDLAGNMQTLSNGDTAVYNAWGRWSRWTGPPASSSSASMTARAGGFRFPRRPPSRPTITAASR